MKKPFFVWWDELDRQDMPNHCMRCGKKKAIWTRYKFERSVFKNGRNYRRIRKCEIPLCKEHGGGTFALSFIVASDFEEEIGVWTRNVCDEFQDALTIHREAEVKAWEEENEDADPDDFDDEKLPPGLRTEPPMPERPKPGIGIYIFLGVIAVTGLLIALTVCCVVFGIFGTAIGLQGLKK